MTAMAACSGCATEPSVKDVAQLKTLPNLNFSVPTVHCAGCIGKIERLLNSVPGIEEARVNLSLKRVSVSASNVAPDVIIDRLKGIGFEAYALDDAILAETRDDTGRALLNRLAVAGFAMMNVMLLSVAVWSGATDATRDLFHFISAAIALPVVAYSAQPFFRSAWTALSARSLNMDVPISLAIILAAGMSLYETTQSGAHAYFDAALSLTFFLLIGRFLDHKTRTAARSAAKELSALEVQTAQKLEGGQLVATQVSKLRVGDQVLVTTGMRVPVDGILDAEAHVDRSFLTGESASVALQQGDAVQAGVINLSAPFQMTATAVGEDTSLRRVASLVELAENSRSSYTALADRAAQVYAPLVHILALAAFIAWVWISGDIRYALNIAIAVLIITCPCALGLAVPAVATAAISKLYESGFLVKHDTALERLAEVDTVVFDKTGTVTRAGADVDLSAFSQHEKSLIRSISQYSAHPISKAIHAALPDCPTVQLTKITEHAGHGVEAIYEGHKVRLGRADWLGAEVEGTAFQIGDAQARPITLLEKIREGVSQAVIEFQNQGLDVVLLTGDREKAAKPVAETLGITTYQSCVTAEEKHEILSDMADEGRKVLMIGDGLNDTAALAVAHASIAPASALDASRTASDVVIMRESFSDLPMVLNVARSVTHLSKQNFGIAALYNVIAVPVALLGFATPLVAALAMSSSSISVLLNALRVRRVS